MTADASVKTSPLAATARQRHTGVALTGLALRQIRRGALVVLVVTAGMSALVAALYDSTFSGRVDATALQALAASPAIRILFGPPLALDDPGGFTVWRTGTPLAVIVGAWALLAATRITRGEEDAGRWDLLLAGRTHARDVVAWQLAVLAAVVLIVGVGVSSAMLAAGTAVTGSVLHGAAIAGVGLCFAAVGAAAAQVLPTRASATGLSLAVLGAMLMMRMVADGVDTLVWMRWMSPFGLAAQMAPYAHDNALPLLGLVVAPALFGIGAIAAAGRRDIGRGLVNVTSRRDPRLRLLRSVTAFAMRRTIRPLLGWMPGVGAYYLLIGLLVESVTDFLADNPRFAELAAGAGFAGLGTTTGFAAALFAVLGIPAGVYAAARIAAAASDEITRHSVLLFAQPMTRIRVARAEITAATAATATLLATAAVAMWAGTTMTGTPLGLGAALAGAINVAPIAALCLGAAVLAWGWAPHAVLAIGALPAVGGFLLHTLATSTHAPAWVDQLSPFAHLAGVPHTPPDWAASAALTAIGAAFAILGVVGYHHRDLAV